MDQRRDRANPAVGHFRRGIPMLIFRLAPSLASNIQDEPHINGIVTPRSLPGDYFQINVH
jgi:hypothetical protein